MIATESRFGSSSLKRISLFYSGGSCWRILSAGILPDKKMYVSEEYVRAVRGGIGHVKAAGNYAASLYASRMRPIWAILQVLWLDSVEKKYVEEVGTSNIFFLIGDELNTPPLGGSILPGVTRNSVITLARHLGTKVVERPISIEEVIANFTKWFIEGSFCFRNGGSRFSCRTDSFPRQEYLINGGKTGVLAGEIVQ